MTATREARSDRCVTPGDDARGGRSADAMLHIRHALASRTCSVPSSVWSRGRSPANRDPPTMRRPIAVLGTIVLTLALSAPVLGGWDPAKGRHQTAAPTSAERLGAITPAPVIDRARTGQGHPLGWGGPCPNACASLTIADVATPLPPEGAQPNACTDAAAETSRRVSSEAPARKRLHRERQRRRAARGYQQ
jgi:hypothetical protein